MATRNMFAIVLGLSAYFLGTKLLHNSDTLSVKFEDMSTEIKNWREMGQTVEINGQEMFYIYRKCSNPKIKNPETFAIVHGFPSSSFEYHKVIDDLSKHGNVFLNDHVGFGFSAVPLANYTYSLGEAAENLLSLWRHVGVRNAHVISHDMGDSVVTEILARRHRKMLPSDFDHFFKSVTFTNGGMRYKMINFRASQLISMYPAIAKPLIGFGSSIGILETVFKKQVLSVWSPFFDNVEERDRDIHNLYLLNAYHDKLLYSYKLAYYLCDRSNFEFRWFDALGKLDVPCRFVWSDSDAVSPVDIPVSFRNMVPNFKLTIVERGGHFWMLENPGRWTQEVIKVLT